LKPGALMHNIGMTRALVMSEAVTMGLGWSHTRRSRRTPNRQRC